MIEARNMQHAHEAVESFYKMDPSRQQELLEPTYKEQRSPPRVRIPKLFRTVETEKHIALLMEFINGETLDWRMRVKLNAIHSPLGWRPNPYMRGGLSYFEKDLYAYADAIGFLLSLATPPDARPGPVGGGSPNHSIFLDENACENELPYEFMSINDLAIEVNKVRNHER